MDLTTKLPKQEVFSGIQIDHDVGYHRQFQNNPPTRIFRFWSRQGVGVTLNKGKLVY